MERIEGGSQGGDDYCPHVVIPNFLGGNWVCGSTVLITSSWWRVLLDVPGLTYLNVCVSSVSVCLSYCFLRVITSQKCLSIMTINLICEFFSYCLLQMYVVKSLFGVMNSHGSNSESTRPSLDSKETAFENPGSCDFRRIVQ